MHSNRQYDVEDENADSQDFLHNYTKLINSVVFPNLSPRYPASTPNSFRALVTRSCMTEI